MPQVELDGQIIEYDDKHSFKDHTGRVLKLHSGASDFNGNVIYASCFSQEIPDSKVFPDDLENATFVKCNLDNVFIDSNWKNTKLIQCTQRRFKIQKDARHWEVDQDLYPIKVMNEEGWKQRGLSVDPIDIPKQVYNTQIITKDEYDKTFGQGKFPVNSLYIEIPKIKKITTVRQRMVVLVVALAKMTHLKNVEDITSKFKLTPANLRVIDADVDIVEIEGEASMYDDLERIKKVGG